MDKSRIDSESSRFNSIAAAVAIVSSQHSRIENAIIYATSVPYLYYNTPLFYQSSLFSDRISLARVFSHGPSADFNSIFFCFRFAFKHDSNSFAARAWVFAWFY